MLWSRHICALSCPPPQPVECALPELSIKEPRYTKL
ncbi:unnamed protein product [Callosobruchus maculatus]|uniref:Uncharacterized protein n=1 Tax=Callosobruchus maculatus TaxID=64391 RepID=A0A653CYA1_CALMS|nr:unnamed protein product [Callosobruchus maculatus]